MRGTRARTTFLVVKWSKYMLVEMVTVLSDEADNGADKGWGGVGLGWEDSGRGGGLAEVAGGGGVDGAPGARVRPVLAARIRLRRRRRRRRFHPSRSGGQPCRSRALAGGRGLGGLHSRFGGVGGGAMERRGGAGTDLGVGQVALGGAVLRALGVDPTVAARGGRGR